jgi:hypothetical protein
MLIVFCGVIQCLDLSSTMVKFQAIIFLLFFPYVFGFVGMKGWTTQSSGKNLSRLGKQFGAESRNKSWTKAIK